MSNEKILEMVRTYKELSVFVKQIEEEIEAVKQSVIDELNKRQVNELIVDVFTIRYTSYTTSRIDSQAIKRELPEIAAKFTQMTEAKRFSIVWE